MVRAVQRTKAHMADGWTVKGTSDAIFVTAPPIRWCAYTRRNANGFSPRGMNLDTLERVLRESLRGIQLCLGSGLINAALVLLYSGIDTASSLDLAFTSSKGRDRYTQWCETYMLKNALFDFTSLELYSARCGVVHETSVRSSLTDKGKAREIVYAWGNSDVSMLREMNALAGMTDNVPVQFESLVRAYEAGLNTFIESLRSNKDRADFALEKGAKCLVTHSKDEMQSLLERGKAMVRDIR